MILYMNGLQYWESRTKILITYKVSHINVDSCKKVADLPHHAK